MKIKDLLEFTINEAKRLGAFHASAKMTEKEYTYYSIKNRKIQEVNASTSRSFSIGLFAHGKYMIVSTKDLRKNSISDFLQKNLEIIKYMDVDPYRTLPDKIYMDKKLIKIKDLHDESIRALNRQQKIDIALNLSNYVADKSKLIFANETYYYDKEVRLFYANSDNYFREDKRTSFHLGGTGYVKDRGKTERAWWGTGSTLFKDMQKVCDVGDIIVEKTLKKRGARPHKSGNYDLLIDNQITGRILNMVIRPLGGSYLDQKQSFLMNMKGKKIASSNLTISSDPFIEKGFGSESFYSNGIPAEKFTPIKNGVLKDFLIGHYYSKKLKMKRTVPELSNVIIKGNHTLSSMQKEIKKGIYITGLLGGNFNSVTGDFSKGINGFLIENGKITAPINGMNFSGNLLKSLKSITKVGNNYFPYSNWRSPSIIIKNATISGKG